MGTLSFKVLLSSFLVFYSCSGNGINDKEIDTFISKYDSVNFSDFINVSITYRDSDWGDDIYMVARQGGDFPPYVVHFNKRKNRVTGIDNRLLKQSNFENYFTSNQIENLMKRFVKYNVQNLSVDSLGNVFISPFQGEHSPTFLRLRTVTGDSIVRKGYVYKLYRERWYLNKRD